MGITLDLKLARERLRSAVDIAESDQPLPTEWEKRAMLVGAARAMTYTPMLGTGLLARVTNHQADALALKKTTDAGGYSTRSLCHKVLVPVAVERGFDIRNTGREPLNNQPFFGNDRVDTAERVKFPNDHRYLVESLTRANTLAQDEALLALAAFIRVCIRRAESRERPDLSNVAVELRATITAAKALLSVSEGGRRAQALAAAAFDIVFGEASVWSLRINDPSSHFPGDVQYVDASGIPLASAEVRDKPVTLAEIEQFAQALADARITRGIVVAIASGQPTLNYTQLIERIAQERGVLLTVLDSIEDLLLTAFAWSPTPLTEVLAHFPEAVNKRLQGIEVDQSTLRRWQELVNPAPVTDQFSP